MSDRLLITGATGFIGSRLAVLARHAAWEICTDRVNLLDVDETERLIARVRPTHLIHLAWFVEPATYWTSPANHEWADAAKHLFSSFAKHGGRRLVGVGTSAEYDWSDGVCTEKSTQLRPATVYGEAKKRVSEDAAAICREHQLSGAWARVFMAYGPGEPASRFVPTVIRTLLQGGTVRCLTAARDFIHVEDVAGALLALAGATVEGAVNVGSGTATQLCDVASMLATTIGVQGNVEQVPAESEAPLVVADVTRLRHEVGFEPRFSLEEGLAHALAWWRGQLSS